MRNIQTTPVNSTASNNYRIEFYPSIEDFVHVSARINDSAYKPAASSYLFYTFLLMNGIVFPVYLFLSDQFLAGVAVFVLNLAALLFLMPKVNPDAYRKYYESLYGDRDEHIATVELTQDGIGYSSDDAEMFWYWGRIKSIEETDNSIFFFDKCNGFGVRKNGFPYREQEIAFIDFARERIERAQSSRLPS